VNRFRALVALVVITAAAPAVLAQISACCTAPIALRGSTSSGGEAVRGECLTSNSNCYAIYGNAAMGTYAAFLEGGKGVVVRADDSSATGLTAYAQGTSSYGLNAGSNAYRAAYVKANSNAFHSLYVDSQDGPTQSTAALNVRGAARIEGNLIVVGAKTGYVVDIMRNVDAGALEPGDVVTIVGNSPAVLGEIPVVTVRKADRAYDTGVAGVVDQAWYAPDAATKMVYETQELNLRLEMQARTRARDEATSVGRGKLPMATSSTPEARMTEERGTVHALAGVVTTAPGGYISVVTLGAFKMIKVDATSGPIHAGDLLTTSANPGYAMKVTDKVEAIGAIIGKALGNLDGGTGTIPVLVMQR
jgi:hypothetical protein